MHQIPIFKCPSHLSLILPTYQLHLILHFHHHSLQYQHRLLIRHHHSNLPSKHSFQPFHLQQQRPCQHRIPHKLHQQSLLHRITEHKRISHHSIKHHHQHFHLKRQHLRSCTMWHHRPLHIHLRSTIHHQLPQCLHHIITQLRISPLY